MKITFLLIIVLLFHGCATFKSHDPTHHTVSEHHKYSFPDYVTIRGKIAPNLKVFANVTKRSVMDGTRCGGPDTLGSSIWTPLIDETEDIEAEYENGEFVIKTPYLKDRWWQTCQWYPEKIYLYVIYEEEKKSIRYWDHAFTLYLYRRGEVQQRDKFPVNQRLSITCSPSPIFKPQMSCFSDQVETPYLVINNYKQKMMNLLVDFKCDPDLAKEE